MAALEVAEQSVSWKPYVELSAVERALCRRRLSAATAWFSLPTSRALNAFCARSRAVWVTYGSRSIMIAMRMKYV